MKMNSYRISASQQGAGLIEVMVSLLILAVGLLGVLSLQANGLNSNTRAEFVTEAQLLAQDMTDRILAYGTAGGAGAGEYGGTDTSSATPDPDCESPASGGCGAVNTVSFDRNEWGQLLANSSLPGAQGTVTWNDPVYRVRILWDQDRTGATGTSCGNDKSVDLTCFDMEFQIR
jgi:type IV pilus assembly protein PilV